MTLDPALVRLYVSAERRALAGAARDVFGQLEPRAVQPAQPLADGVHVAIDGPRPVDLRATRTGVARCALRCASCDGAIVTGERVRVRRDGAALHWYCGRLA